MNQIGVELTRIHDESDQVRAPTVWHVGGFDLNYRIPMMLRLREFGFRVVAVGNHCGSEFANCEIPYYDYPLSRKFAPLHDAIAYRKLARLFREHSPDLVHAFHTKPSIIATLAGEAAGVKARVRTVTGMGNLYASDHLSSRMLRPIYEFMQRRASSAASFTIFQNRDDHEYFEKNRLVDSEFSCVVPGSGIDVRDFVSRMPTGTAREDLRRKLRLKSGPTITMVSRMVRAKGVMEFLAASRNLKAKFPNANFLLVGSLSSSPGNNVTEAEIDEYESSAIYLGYRTDVPAILGISDVFVLPSYYREGIPRSLLEACAARLPIVTTDMPGCRDVVQQNANGFVVPPRDTDSLIAAIERLVESEEVRRVMGVAGHRYVAEKFDLASVASAYVSIYERLLSENNYVDESWRPKRPR